MLASVLVLVSMVSALTLVLVALVSVLSMVQVLLVLVPLVSAPVLALLLASWLASVLSRLAVGQRTGWPPAPAW